MVKGGGGPAELGLGGEDHFVGWVVTLLVTGRAVATMATVPRASTVGDVCYGSPLLFKLLGKSQHVDFAMPNFAMPNLLTL